MTQFNLLPDIKQQYLKADRQRKLVISVSILACIVAILATALIYSLTYLQKRQINSLSTSIQNQGLKITDNKNLNSILTINNQIGTLNTLHSQEPAVANLANYLYKLIPVSANISNLTLTFASNTSSSSDALGSNNTNSMTIEGSAQSLAVINQLVDSLEYATFTIKGTPGSQKAFSSVVLSSFGVPTNSTPATYTINFNFNPDLFNITDQVNLNIPTKVTTRSELDQPTDLFKPNPSAKKGAN